MEFIGNGERAFEAAVNVFGNFGVNLGGTLAVLLNVAAGEAVGGAVAVQRDSEGRVDLFGGAFHLKAAAAGMTAGDLETFRGQELGC
jgi:hypothetical protein